MSSANERYRLSNVQMWPCNYSTDVFATSMRLARVAFAFISCLACVAFVFSTRKLMLSRRNLWWLELSMISTPPSRDKDGNQFMTTHVFSSERVFVQDSHEIVPIRQMLTQVASCLMERSLYCTTETMLDGKEGVNRPSWKWSKEHTIPRGFLRALDVIISV